MKSCIDCFECKVKMPIGVDSNKTILWEDGEVNCKKGHWISKYKETPRSIKYFTRLNGKYCFLGEGTRKHLKILRLAEECADYQEI